MVPTSVSTITDPVERTRAYMDSVATRWQVIRNLEPPLTESQFWLDTGEWEAYYQLRRGGIFGIKANDWQEAWNDTTQWDQILSGYEAKFLGQASGPNVPTKPGAVDPTKETDPTGTIAAARKFPWDLAALVLVVVVAGAVIYKEVDAAA